MSRNWSQRKQIEKQNEKNRSANDMVREQIEEVKKTCATGLDIVKFKLFCEQKEICMYSGASLDINRLFEPGYVDIDHIIPYSCSFDDSYINKVLVLSPENRQKGDRLPLEYMANDAQKAEQFRIRVETTIRDYRKRQKLLKEHMSDDEEKSFRERNLSDTQYITRAVYNILNDYLACEPSKSKHPVRAVNGVITDYIRKRLGLKKVREDGDLHHAMDAAIVAIITDSMIQRISNYSKRREWNKKRTSDYVDPETGELMTREAYDKKYAPDFPEPWLMFRKELEARLSENPYDEIMALHLPMYDADEEIKPIFVSRMPSRKVTGSTYEATTRSAKKPGYTVSKTPLTELKLDKEGEIKGYYEPDSDRLLYEALKNRLEEYGGDAKKAFAEPFRKPKRDGTPGPLVQKVKIYEKVTRTFETNGGIAKNGTMVRIDVYYVPDDGYYFVPIYTADTVKEHLPNRAVTRGDQWKPMQEEHFRFSLYPGDLVLVRSKKEIKLSLVNKKSTADSTVARKEWLLYYGGADISTGSITLMTHDRKYKIKSMGVKRLLSMKKYEVDVLGEYHKVHLPEIRTDFR